MTDMSMKAYRTPPQAEFRAEEELRAAGYVAFVPVEYRWQRGGKGRSRRFKVRRALAPGYVIASGKPSEARHVRSCVGRLKPTEVTHMHAVSGREADAEPKAPTWQPGDAAVIASGPFAGSAVTIIEARGKVALVRGYVFGAERDSIGVHVQQLAKPAV